MKMKLLKFALVSVPLMPLLAFAFDPMDDIVTPLGEIINGIAPLVMVLVFIAFCWGLVKYIMSAGDPEKAKEGKSIMIYGVLALFVMASVWGLTTTLADSVLNLDEGIVPGPELIPGGGE